MVPAPRRGEALPSWLGAVARLYGAGQGSALTRVGLDAGPGRRRSVNRLKSYSYWLTAQEADRVCAATGVRREAAMGMTLRRVLESAVQSGDALERPYARGDFEPRALRRFFVFRNTVNVCPACLKAGPGVRWPWFWYFQYAVLCPVHYCYLLSACPGCGEGFHPADFAAGPWACRRAVASPDWPRKEEGRTPCRATLADLRARWSRDQVLIDAQQRLFLLLTADEDTWRAKRGLFGDLCTLYIFAWLYVVPEELAGADREVVRALEKFLAAGYRSYRLGIWKGGGRTRDHYLRAAFVRVAGQAVFSQDVPAAVEQLGRRWPQKKFAVVFASYSKNALVQGTERLDALLEASTSAYCLESVRRWRAHHALGW
ncbi:TniQ family protein [Streptomyces olivoreticuli]|nr:TniQ family protein [Streptomyces olivoreticuli]WKK26938.1 TniQ family protein [Streptomyces olivoreticuli]